MLPSLAVVMTWMTRPPTLVRALMCSNQGMNSPKSSALRTARVPEGHDEQSLFDAAGVESLFEPQPVNVRAADWWRTLPVSAGGRGGAT